MARRNKKKVKKDSFLHAGTKKSIVGVSLIAVALILFLASWSKAGPAGNFIYGALERLFGVGYFLFPVLALAVALYLLVNHEKKVLAVTLIGALIAFFAGLGFLDILFDGRGGVVGVLVGALESAFGLVAAIVITLAAFVASLIVAFNTPLSFNMPRLALGRRNEEEDVEAALASAEDNEDEEYEDEEEEEEEEEEPAVNGMTDLPDKAVASGVPAVFTSGTKYEAPPLSLLKATIEKPTSGDLRANANIIKRTLESFGIAVEMGEINIGPKVTRYTLKPAEGIKLTRITALNPDLSLSLAAHPIRIEAPIPGKSFVGIEVPNKSAAVVRLGSLMSYSDFSESGPLTFALGRDVSGDPVFVNIEKMPHLLVAGATGSGKSVTIHSILTSLLFKNSPDVLKLILIDPKRVELSAYEGIPHLISSVVTNPKKSVGVFRWAIQEMDRRYETLLAAGVRDIGSYHTQKKKDKEPMPYIVIVVDELADLMATYGREVEGSIVRLAQMARATGIHLILSTQRPSVEVITGLIKANITARIALQVASQVDSRTILDIGGAEKLLGGGDLLFVSSESSKLKRVQASFITEEEVRKVVNYICEHNDMAPALFSSIDSDAEQLDPEEGNKELFDDLADDEKDELYDEAITLVRESQKASASYLQRRLKIGYARAARILDIMESEGLVSPADGAKPRDILM